MDPLPAEPGLGTLYNAAWMSTQNVEDEDLLLAELLKEEEIAT